MNIPFAKAYFKISPLGTWKDHLISEYEGRRNFPGTDYLTPKKQPIYAIDDGTLTEQIDIYGGKYAVLTIGKDKWYFLHCSNVIMDGKKSRKVKSGEKIAITGNTGMSTGPHTHVSLKRGNKYINPHLVLQNIYKMKELQKQLDILENQLETARKTSKDFKESNEILSTKNKQLEADYHDLEQRLSRREEDVETLKMEILKLKRNESEEFNILQKLYAIFRSIFKK